ncbi:hypothetical protein, conserved [Plasmodium gonderi]|uniref:CS domain-containing protein n=1 Tax=Plasmodium gonderi TaxID=77519 RepID=A0A1Y1JMC6_PLAGO|nr:hypothetical protein, conserved [Plasmodium gonderi]GAW82357.1 hypothetical protein, conserved [Plasmodium gonderi]
MPQLLKIIKIVLCALFTFQWKLVHSFNSFHTCKKSYSTKIINKVIYVDRQLRRTCLYTTIPKKVTSFCNRKKKIKCLPHSKEEEGDELGIELENFVKELEEGKYGDDSLKLYREVERNSLEKEEKESQTMNENDEQINVHNVEDIINNTDSNLKNTIKRAFYNTEINEHDNEDVKKEYNMMKKIEKTFDEFDDINYPEDKLNMKNIFEKINSMKDEKNPETPFKDTAKTLMKYKGLLHMPFERCRLLNDGQFDWRESLDHLELNIPIFEETDIKDIFFQFGNDYIKLEVLRNNNKILMLNNKLCGKINYGEAYWVIAGDYKNSKKHINLVIPKMGAFKYIWEKLLQDGERAESMIFSTDPK